MAEKYDVNAALARLDAIEKRLKEAEGKSEFSNKRKKIQKLEPKKKVGLGGTGINTRKQLEQIDD